MLKIRNDDDDDGGNGKTRIVLVEAKKAMSFCGWLKIFKRRKHAAVGSEESDERTSSAAKSGEAGRKRTPGSGSSDRTAANGGERNAKNSAGTDEVKVKNGDESDVDDDFWATPVEEAKADENDEGESAHNYWKAQYTLNPSQLGYYLLFSRKVSSIVCGNINPS